ncbi:MAG: AAA family ATPase [Eubacteriales bacterium]|nr:AAA family ATPase [Eubacteriales bacterium]
MNTDHINSSRKQTLAKAYSLFLETRNPLSPEMIIIQSRFFSLEYAEAFGDDALYLSFLKNLVNERQNLSFPEEPALYEKYFRDCITLKKLKDTLPGYTTENYLSDTIRMMENLKTPYYSAYVKTLLALKTIFSDSNLMSRTLQEFYGIMIKSSTRKLTLIALIAEQGHFYKELPIHDEEMIRGLLLSNLAIFAEENDSISLSTLQQYLSKENAFLQEFIAEHDIHHTTLSELLAERMIYMTDSLENTMDKDTEPASSQIILSEFLNEYGYNMNARNYVTNPAIGRESEIQDLALILISPKKSPILIGDAGVGKTSVVEGLAYALKEGNVPTLLKDKKLFKLTTTSLLSGTKYVGEMEDRMKKLMDELEKHPEVILFIDEIHTIVGAGSTESSNNDISNMLKPYIDRGDIKLIGATTTAEYHRFIKYDQALSRRFYPILVEEPDKEMCLEILFQTIPSISHETSVANPFSKEETFALLSTLLEVSTLENQPDDLKTHWPELPLSLLEIAFSYAALDSRTTLCVDDFIHAVSHSNRLHKKVKSTASEVFAKFL